MSQPRERRMFLGTATGVYAALIVLVLTGQVDVGDWRRLAIPGLILVLLWCQPWALLDRPATPAETSPPGTSPAGTFVYAGRRRQEIAGNIDRIIDEVDRNIQRVEPVVPAALREEEFIPNLATLVRWARETRAQRTLRDRDLGEIINFAGFGAALLQRRPLTPDEWMIVAEGVAQALAGRTPTRPNAPDARALSEAIVAAARQPGPAR